MTPHTEHRDSVQAHDMSVMPREEHQVRRSGIDSSARIWLLPQEWVASLRQEGLAVPLILLLVPVSVTLWVYFGRDAHALPLLTPLARHWDRDVLAVVYEYILALLLLFAVPAVAARFLLGCRLAEVGLTVGDRALGWRLVAILLPLALISAYIGSFDPAMQREYPLAKSALIDPLLFTGIEALYLSFYFAWEFLFRGFMLFGLEREWGPVAAILIQTMPSTLAHIGKPFAEIVAALLAGLVLGYVAVRTRSILYGLLMHAVVGIILDILVVMHTR